MFQPAPPPPQQPQYAPPQPQYAPPPPQYAPPLPRGIQLPTWLMALLFAAGFLLLLGGVYWYVNSQHNSSAVIDTTAAKPAAPKENPVQKYIEVTGIRFAGSSKGPVVSFVVVNHSDSDLVGLSGNVKVWGLTQKAEEDPVGTFTFQTSMPAQSSKELTLPFTTKLKLMELPDWQNVKVGVEITAPSGA
jgi:hypothetical protein